MKWITIPAGMQCCCSPVNGDCCGRFVPVPPVSTDRPSDLADILSQFTNLIMNERVAAYNQGVDDERKRHASANGHDGSTELLELADVIEAVRGDRGLLRVSGLQGDAQDIGVIGIDTFIGLLRRAIPRSGASHIMCIGWPTIRRLMTGESVWFDDIQAGAVAADDLLGNAIVTEICMNGTPVETIKTAVPHSHKEKAQPHD